MSKNYEELLNKVEILNDLVALSLMQANETKEREHLIKKQEMRVGEKLINYLKFKQEGWFIINISNPGWENVEDKPTKEHRLKLTMFPLDFNDKEKVFDSLREE